MTRFVIVLLSAASLTPASRGDDPGLSLRVKVALALACDCGRCGDARKEMPPTAAKKAGKKAGALDWFVSADRGPEVAPPPKVAPEAKKLPVQAAACPPTPYAEVRRRVAGGDKVILLVRPPATLTKLPTRLGWSTVVCEDAPLMAGRYDCEVFGGRPCATEAERYDQVPRTALDWYGRLMLGQR